MSTTNNSEQISNDAEIALAELACANTALFHIRAARNCVNAIVGSKFVLVGDSYEVANNLTNLEAKVKEMIKKIEPIASQAGEYP
jgi:hypothetical protein